MTNDQNFVLLSMDFQRAMCEPDGSVGSGGLAAEIARRGTLDRVADALGTFRSNQWPVLHVRVSFDANFTNMTSASPRFAWFRANAALIESAEETQIVPALLPTKDEPLIEKGCVNPFVGTRLREFLNLRQFHHLVLAGVATNHVVEATARYAADIGFKVTVVEDLCASSSPELHEFAVHNILPSYGAVMSLDELLATLESAD